MFCHDDGTLSLSQTTDERYVWAELAELRHDHRCLQFPYDLQGLRQFRPTAQSVSTLACLHFRDPLIYRKPSERAIVSMTDR